MTISARFCAVCSHKWLSSAVCEAARDTTPHGHPSSAHCIQERARSPRYGSTRPPADAQDDVFFRHLVANMRNGVLAIRRTGEIVLINAEARRIFGLDAEAELAGETYTHVLRQHPDILRVMAGALELTSLPNRAELRRGRPTPCSATRCLSSAMPLTRSSARRSSSRT